MNNRIKEVTEQLSKIVLSAPDGFYKERFESFFASLPEFQETKWIKCSDRMPKEGDSVWLYFGSQNRGMTQQPKFEVNLGTSATHWAPCKLPDKPEEDSELVKKLKAVRDSKDSRSFDLALKQVIEIIEEYENGLRK